MNEKYTDHAQLFKSLGSNDLKKIESIADASNWACAFIQNNYKVTSARINNGYCFIWAYLVWAAMQSAEVEFVSSNTHVVIKFRDKYYDADNIDGNVEMPNTTTYCVRERLSVWGLSWFWVRVGIKRIEFRKLLKSTCHTIYKDISAGGTVLSQDEIDCLQFSDMPPEYGSR